MKIISNKEDKLILKGNKTDNYSVKLMHEVLNRPVSLPSPFTVLSIWNPLVPLKVDFFAWEAAWGKVLTLDQLKRRGRPVANRCYLRENKEETIEHLLVHCQHARTLWEIILEIVGIEWVFPFSVRHALLSWQGAQVGKKRKKVWRAAPLCLFWTIWRERKRVAFDNEVFSAHRLKRSFICNFWSWSNVYSWG